MQFLDLLWSLHRLLGLVAKSSPPSGKIFDIDIEKMEYAKAPGSIPGGGILAVQRLSYDSLPTTSLSRAFKLAPKASDRAATTPVDLSPNGSSVISDA